MFEQMWPLTTAVLNAAESAAKLHRQRGL